MEAVSHELNKRIRENKEWIERLARVGFFTKGIVYCLLGTMTTLSALHLGGEKTDRDDVFQLIYRQPFGKVLLALTALGLLSYACWRLFESLKNPGGKKTIVRIGYAGSGLLYGSLAFSAAMLAIKNSDNSGGGNQEAVAQALQQPFGKALVLIAALVIIAKACYQFYKAFTGKFKSDLYLDKQQSRLISRAGAWGYAARGVVLAIVGYFLIRAAFQENPEEATDTHGAFSFIENGFGTWLLGIVAFGLVCYGIFMIVRGWYGRFRVAG